MVNVFTGTAPITIFAPVNKAFESLPPGKLDTLFKPGHRTELAALINYHVLSGKMTSADIARQIKQNNGSAVLVTLAGKKLTAKIDSNRNIVLTDESGMNSIISRFDVLQRNGMLHVITGVLMPKP